MVATKKPSTRGSGSASAGRKPGGSRGRDVEDEFGDAFLNVAPSRGRWFAALFIAVLSVVGMLLFQRGSSEPYAAFAGAVSEATLARIEGLAEHVQVNGRADERGQHREFGVGQNYLSQHSVTFLHGPSSDQDVLGSVVADLLGVAKRAAKARGWAIGSTRLVPRCLELIEYMGSSVISENDQSLGWHDDGATQITVAVLLSHREDFDGGDLQVRQADGTVASIGWPSRGDAMAWRGWHVHRVLPVKNGTRRVVVAEFWSDRKRGAGARALAGDRPLDDAQRYRDALALDPASPALHAGIGVIAAKQDDVELAELSFRQAVSLGPGDASALTGLGATLIRADRVKAALSLAGLGSSASSARAAEAENALRRATALEPTGAEAPYDLALLFERTARKAEAAVWREVALSADPSLLERRGAAMSDSSRLHS